MKKALAGLLLTSDREDPLKFTIVGKNDYTCIWYFACGADSLAAIKSECQLSHAAQYGVLEMIIKLNFNTNSVY
jgi:hypothetical protein